MPGPGYKKTPQQIRALREAKVVAALPRQLAAAENNLKNAQNRLRWLNKSYKELTFFGISLNSFIIRNDKNNNISDQFKGSVTAPLIQYDGQPSFLLGQRSRFAEPYLGRAAYEQAKKDAYAAVAAANSEVTRLKKSTKQAADTAAKVNTTADPKFIDRSNTPAVYNIGSVGDAYFNGETVIAENTSGDFGQDSSSVNDWRIRNKPSSVRNAQALWKKGVNSKGMIQTWMPPEQAKVTGTMMKNNDDLKGIYDSFSSKRFGFQFLYNPSSVGQTFGGVPDVDLAWIASGKGQSNLTNPDVTQSTVGFEVLINRIPDMEMLKKYRNSSGDITETTISSAPVHPRDVWSGRRLTTDKEYATTLKAIQNSGTMYDIEFLLKTLLGMELYTSLRPGEKTADLGFLAPKPVELHLGKSLRYLVYISSFTINHVIFDENMVPLFTTLRINAARVPDIATDKKK